MRMNSDDYIDRWAEIEAKKERNFHVEQHRTSRELVSSSPILIIHVTCRCGLSYTTKDGTFATGNAAFFELMEHKTACTHP